MVIYIDNDYKCHIDADIGRAAFDVEYFDDKCSAFIEGHRYVPAGGTWTRSDGVVFRGEMISPWKEYSWLAAIQAQHESDEAVHSEELGELVDIIYENDLEVIG